MLYFSKKLPASVNLQPIRVPIVNRICRRNNITVSSRTVFDQKLQIFFQRIKLLFIGLQLVSDLVDTIFNFFPVHAPENDSLPQAFKPRCLKSPWQPAACPQESNETNTRLAAAIMALYVGPSPKCGNPYKVGRGKHPAGEAVMLYRRDLLAGLLPFRVKDVRRELKAWI
jgi:hypothetical protein